eukprot:Skav206881  [mRNA]  locus=scaffold5240:23016:29590:- [translate_table: standard]
MLSRRRLGDVDRVCGFSARTSGLLREIGIPFETVNVLDENNNPGVREAICASESHAAVKEYGQWPTIPQLYVAGQLVGGEESSSEKAEPAKYATGAGAGGAGGAAGGGCCGCCGCGITKLWSRKADASHALDGSVKNKHWPEPVMV